MSAMRFPKLHRLIVPAAALAVGEERDAAEKTTRFEHFQRCHDA
jgi:hypothetical protein